MLAEVLRLRSKSFQVIAFFILVVGVEGASARPLDPISGDELSARISALTHEPWNGRASDGGRAPANCKEIKVTMDVIDPQLREKREVAVSLFRPASSAKVPAVIVVPTMNGVTVVEPKIASQLCSNGIAAVIADVVDTSLPREMPGSGHEDAVNRRAILALRTLLDLLSNHPAIDRDRLGMIGSSLGGIVTSMMVGVEPERIKAAVIAVGAGNLPFVLSTSDNSNVSELRRQRMEHLKLANSEAYEDWLRPIVKFDPMFFTPRAVKDRIMMVTAKADTKVPYEMQRALHEAFGRPTVSEYSGGHIETILSMTYFYFGEIVNFYKSRFGMSAFYVPPVTVHPPLTPEERASLGIR